MRVCENCCDYMYPNCDAGRSAKYCSACKVVTCESGAVVGAPTMVVGAGAWRPRAMSLGTAWQPDW